MFTPTLSADPAVRARAALRRGSRPTCRWRAYSSCTSVASSRRLDISRSINHILLGSFVLIPEDLGGAEAEVRQSRRRGSRFARGWRVRDHHWYTHPVTRGDTRSRARTRTRLPRIATMAAASSVSGLVGQAMGFAPIRGGGYPALHHLMPASSLLQYRSLGSTEYGFGVPTTSLRETTLSVSRRPVSRRCALGPLGPQPALHDRAP